VIYSAPTTRRNQNCANNPAENRNSEQALESGSRSEPARLRRPRLASGTATRPSRKTTQYGSNCRASERGGKPPAERLRSTVRNDAQTSASVPGHATCQQDPISAPTTSGRIGQKLAPFRVLRPAQKQGTNQKTRKRPHTERGGGRAAMGTSARDGAPRGLTPAPAQSAAQTAFLFATVECAAPLTRGLVGIGKATRPLPRRPVPTRRRPLRGRVARCRHAARARGTSASHPGPGHRRPQPPVGVIQAGARRGASDPRSTVPSSDRGPDRDCCENGTLKLHTAVFFSKVSITTYCRYATV
jgi:hypothetical protein